MKNFKSFTPKVDNSRRLVMTRFYVGVNNSNNFCYKITRISKSDKEDKKFKSLYSFGTDDFMSVKYFCNSRTGEKVRVFKKPFKSIFGVKEKNNPLDIWNSQIVK
jgi:hypothetical protein